MIILIRCDCPRLFERTPGRSLILAFCFNIDFGYSKLVLGWCPLNDKNASFWPPKVVKSPTVLSCLTFLSETYLLAAFISSISINFSIALFSSKMSSGLGRTLNSEGSSSVRLPSYSSLNLISVFALTLALPIFCNLRELNFSTRYDAFNSPNGNLYSLSIWLGAFFRSSFWIFSPSTNFFNDEQELD